MKVKRKAFGQQQIQRVATLSFSFLGQLKKKEEIKMRNGRRGQKERRAATDLHAKIFYRILYLELSSIMLN